MKILFLIAQVMVTGEKNRIGETTQTRWQQTKTVFRKSYEIQGTEDAGSVPNIKTQKIQALQYEDEDQGIIKRCRLFGLTNSALVYKRQLREKETECGEVRAVRIKPIKLRLSNSIKLTYDQWLADLDPGSNAFLTTGSGMRKISDRGSQIRDAG